MAIAMSLVSLIVCAATLWGIWALRQATATSTEQIKQAHDVFRESHDLMREDLDNISYLVSAERVWMERIKGAEEGADKDAMEDAEGRQCAIVRMRVSKADAENSNN